MKKKILILLLGTMLAVTAAACGDDKEENAEGTEMVEGTENAGEEKIVAASSAFDLNGKDYTKLCDYSAVEVSIEGDYEVAPDAEKEYFANLFTQNGPFYTADPEKTIIGEGDIVNVDYVGKLDGEAFEGGSAKNQLIDVDNNSSANGSPYIEGFTEGLKGASVGDVIDCDVTFPENYQNEELAGKPVVFTFTVNSIQKEMSLEEVDDNFAKEQFQTETVEDMYKDIRMYLEKMAEYEKEKDIYVAVQNYLLDNSTVDVPQDYLDARLADFKRQFITINCGGDESKLEEYATTYYGKTAEELEQEWSISMKENIGLELVMDAIVAEMKLTLDEETYGEYVKAMVTNGRFGTEEMMYQMYGFGDAAYGETYLKDLYLYDQALTKIIDTAKVTVNAPEVPAEETESVEGTEN